MESATQEQTTAEIVEQVAKPMFDFKVPTKKIDDPATHEQFKKSNACQELLGFIGMLVQSVQKTRISDVDLVDSLKPIHDYLNTLD